MREVEPTKKLSGRGLDRQTGAPSCPLVFPTRRLAPARQPAGVRRWSGTVGAFPSSERFAARGHGALSCTVLGNYRSGWFWTPQLGATARPGVPRCAWVWRRRRASPAGEFVRTELQPSGNSHSVQVPTLRCPLGRSSDVVRARRTPGSLLHARPLRRVLSSVAPFAARVRARPAKAVLPRRAR